MTRFVVQRWHARPPLVRPAPAPDEPGWLRFGDVLGVGVFLAESLVGELLERATAALPMETMGLLAGRPCEDASGPYTLVVGAAQAATLDAGRAHVFADTHAMAGLHAAVRRTWPVAEVVGWWHTHPGYGTRFSSVDEATQATFRAASCVGVVVDPTRRHPDALGVYLGPCSGRLWPLSSATRSGVPARLLRQASTVCEGDAA